MRILYIFTKKKFVIELVILKYIYIYMNIILFAYIYIYQIMLCRPLYTNDVYWHAITSPRQSISSSANSHIQRQRHKTLLLYIHDRISRPLLLRRNILSKTVLERRCVRFIFSIRPRPLTVFFLIYPHTNPFGCCRLHVHRSSAVAVRGKKTERAENHYVRRSEGYRRRDVVPDRNKGVSVTLTNSQIDRRREPI